MILIEPNLRTALHSLGNEYHPSDGVTVRGGNDDLNDLSCLTIGGDKNITPKFSWSDVGTRLTELQTQWTNEEYMRNRKAEYPSIAELTVALYDTDDKSVVEAKRAKVKAKYPKP